VEKKGRRQRFSIHIIISRGLRIGVVSSGILMVLGIILYTVTGNISFPAGDVTLPWVFTAFLNLNPAAVISLGILTLIATPVVRVLVAAAAFFHEGDQLYTFVAALVFIILVISFLIAGA